MSSNNTYQADPNHPGEINYYHEMSPQQRLQISISEKSRRARRISEESNPLLGTYIYDEHGRLIRRGQ
tara:strand:+ start:4230 stop:4433 length:204 start_codon:yes stop_codon:yes gene_type:complete